MNANQEFEDALSTIACRVGTSRTPELENSDPIFATSSFSFENAAQAAARFSGDEPGNIYSRFTNPTVRTFERRLAALEGGESAIATASGMSAIMSLCLGVLSAGDHVVSSYSVFGSTINLFKNILSRFGIEFTFVDLVDHQAWEAAVRANTKLLFLETPSNPLTEIADIGALATLAHAAGAMLVVDNCFCTPILQRPLSLGADIVVHSATKYLDGQGRCVGGAVVAPRNIVEEKLIPVMRSGGPCMSPFNAWVFLKGLETLSIRMQHHSRGAGIVAAWLAEQHWVSEVFYPGLPNHPQHDLATRQQSQYGGIVSFEIAGDRETAWRFIDALRLFSITANLGDTRSIVTHPATTTHGRVSAEDRARCGVGERLIRLSIGLEEPDDLIADLARAANA
ncbi:MAG TPA: O-succinylhomoserine sulfhydrylase [Gammaproteobacteria bacterium]|jgi:O-succinylhomoserine sulfhydrylase|nr:O-succinylhomoserine sulfhydrylase [Gammaproteobacteria bacterium]